MIFQHHPDGWVSIDGFQYALSQFLIDEPGYILPPGMNGRIYDNSLGVHHLSDGHNQYGGLVPWPDGETYLSKKATYEAAYNARITAPVTLDDYKKAQSIKLQNACKSAIYAGFSSTALGSTYHYPAEDRDQTNLNGCVTQSYYPGNPTGWTISFYCEDANSVWAKRPHTAAQIQQVGNDGINAIQAALDKNDSLQSQIQAAATIDQVNAIIW